MIPIRFFNAQTLTLLDALVSSASVMGLHIRRSMASTVTKATVQLKRASEELPDSSEDFSTAKKSRESEDRGTFLPKLETEILVADLQYKQTQHYEVLEYFKAKSVSHCFGLWMGQLISTKTKV